MTLSVDQTLVTPGPGAIVERFTLGAAMTAGEAGNIDSSDGTVYEADANAAGRHRAHGVLITDNQGNGNTGGSYASGSDVGMCVFGKLYGFAGMTPGAPVYVSETAGTLTQTAPDGDNACEVGYALSATVLMVCPKEPNGGYLYT